MTDARVALTFDAEHPDLPPGEVVAEEILAILAREAVPATFFVQGRWASAYPEIARRIGAAGHLIGNHSHAHAPLTRFTEDGVLADIAEAESEILAATGIDPRPWFRCPFGEGADDALVLRAIAAAGYRHAGWDVDAVDWEVGRTASSLETDVVTAVLERAGDTVVLLHTWPAPTAAALTGIIRALRDGGAAFVRVDALADVPVGVGETAG
ncbi:MAG: polysaccharide deacetylase family protein [Chloroflexota bacterium]